MATAAVAALSSELHRQEKGIVAVEAQLHRAADDETRAASAHASSWRPRPARVREEIAALDARQSEARESIARLDEQRRAAEDVLGRRAADARRGSRDAPTRWRSVAAEARGRACRAGRAQRRRGGRRRAAWKTRARDLERRLETCAADLTLMRDQRERLLAAAAEGQRLMDERRRRARGPARRYASRPTRTRCRSRPTPNSRKR